MIAARRAAQRRVRVAHAGDGAAAGDRHRARPCAPARWSAGPHCLCPRGRSDGAQRGCGAGRRLSRISQPARPHAASARRVVPRPGLPGGVLIVDCIDGHVPRLPGRARRHGRDAGGHPRSAAAGCRIANPAPEAIPFIETLAGDRAQRPRFLDRAVPDPRRARQDRRGTDLMRAIAPDVGTRPTSRSPWRWPTRIPAISWSIAAATPGSSIWRRCMTARRRSIWRMPRCRPRPCGIPTSAHSCAPSDDRALSIAPIGALGPERASALAPCAAADAPHDLAATPWRSWRAGECRPRAPRDPAIPANGAMPASSRAMQGRMIERVIEPLPRAPATC